MQYLWQTALSTIRATGQPIAPPEMDPTPGWKPTPDKWGAWHPTGCGGAILWTRSLQRPEPKQATLLDDPAHPVLPEWMIKAKLPKGTDRHRVLSMVVDSIGEITGQRPNATRSKGNGSEILKLWRGLGCPPTEEFKADLAVVAHAARECPEELFARDIRAEGWKDGTNRSLSVSTLCVLRKFEERLLVATKWAGDLLDDEPVDDTDDAPSALPRMGS
jgi:hypothetical protein